MAAWSPTTENYVSVCTCAVPMATALRLGIVLFSRQVEWANSRPSLGVCESCVSSTICFSFLSFLATIYDWMFCLFVYCVPLMLLNNCLACQTDFVVCPSGCLAFICSGLTAGLHFLLLNWLLSTCQRVSPVCPACLSLPSRMVRLNEELTLSLPPS